MIATNLAHGVVWANLAAAMLATVMSFLAAKCGMVRHRAEMAATSAIGAVYVAGYIWLLVDYPTHLLRWSETMRGVGIVAWLVVWCWPAARSIKLHREEESAREVISAVLTKKSGDV